MRRHVLFRCMSICVCSAGLAACGSAQEGLKIAYNVLYDTEKDNYEIFVMNPDGSGKKNISNHAGVDWVYYAYEDKLYFISDRDTTHRLYYLYEMDADGNNVRKICPFRLEDSWLSSRKNGTEFVVSGRKDGLRHTLYIIDKTGTILTQLTNDTTEFFNDPLFTPDGKQVVYRYKERQRDTTVTDELWIMHDDGTNRRRLTYYPPEDTTAQWHAYHAGPPVMVPGTGRISFASKRNGSYSIYSIRTDGSDLRQVTPDGFNQLWHSWSPDGSRLAYDGWAVGGEKYSIYLADADGGNPRQLTNEYQFEQAPVFVKVHQ